MYLGFEVTVWYGFSTAGERKLNLNLLIFFNKQWFNEQIALSLNKLKLKCSKE